MRVDPTLAAIRFGTGLRPRLDPPESVAAILKLARQDRMAHDFPLPMYGGVNQTMQDQRRLTKEHRTNRREKIETAEARRTEKALNSVNRQMRQDRYRMLSNSIARAVHSPHGLPERLTWFWMDHFTAQGKSHLYEVLYGDYIDRAIRPHILGRFEDMLSAAITHPMMLHYLDQSASVGPRSRLGIKQPNRGINENLAREILELHTLGVTGPYTQSDVQSLAAALTGWTEKYGHGADWKGRQAEPGPFVVLGASYASADRQADDLRPLLRDLARHPVTARHLSTKLARHFVADDPPRGLVDALTDSYLATDGDLSVVTETLLRHPASWDPVLRNVKWPMEYVASGLRILGLPPAVMRKMKWQRTREVIEGPLAKMGQRWQGASGPDGAAERDIRWVTPQGLAARLEWALAAPNQLLVRLPDPRKTLQGALGDLAPDSLQFAVKSVSLRHEGLALILASPAFQRR